jgi:hypothetical protein
MKASGAGAIIFGDMRTDRLEGFCIRLVLEWCEYANNLQQKSDVC